VEVSKVTVPPAADTHPDKYAVSVTLAPKAGLAGEAVTVAGVNVVAWALLRAASRNSSRKATPPLPFRTREVIARIPFRIVNLDIDWILDILKPPLRITGSPESMCVLSIGHKPSFVYVFPKTIGKNESTVPLP
jgi:hypothetical protein